MTQRFVRKILVPIEDFLKLEAAGGIILILTTVFAMIWANSPLHHFYHDMLHLPVKFQMGSFVLDKTLHHWVNDGLMVIFFFVIGLEIKSEMMTGELSSPKKAALPMFAALGGMIAPALVYLAFNISGGEPKGWAIPMATDIAFAIGVISLLGKRVPLSLKIFLLALAIVDDLGAILVIAFFYTAEISTSYLGVAAFGLAFTFFAQKVGVRAIWIYVILGIIVWLGVLLSGIHATIAGVLLGFLTPATSLFKPVEFSKTLESITHKIKKSIQQNAGPGASHNDADADIEINDHDIYSLQELAFEAVSPLERLVHYLHPWVAFFIMPVFALFNAGVELGGVSFGDLVVSPVAIGIVAGLVIGKPLGIFIFSYLAVKLGFATLPTNTSWGQLIGVGLLAGIGFTMALFICNLALAGSVKEDYAKIAILIASVLASILGSILIVKTCPLRKKS
jgi:NhaA family Na+:H+ antiporter